MEISQKPIKIRQMADSTNNLCIGVIFLIVAVVFVAASVYMIVAGEMDGIIIFLGSLTFMSVSLCWILPYLRYLIFTETSVQVFLGPVKVQEMMAEDICTIMYSTVITNLGRRPEQNRELTEVGILVLSSRSSGYLKMMYRRFAEKEAQTQVFREDREKEEFILHYAIDTHVGNSMRNLRTPKEEGVWIEYTPERLNMVQKLYPNAEDCTG